MPRRWRQQGLSLPRSVLLVGPPGTGKTEVARTIANESGLQFIGVTLADVKAGYVGQSGQKVREIFERARASAPSIVFFDELDNIVPVATAQRGDTFTAEIVSQMLQEMDGIKAQAGHVFVVAATNYPERIEPAIRSRLVETIEIPMPDEVARAGILRRLLRSKPVAFDLASDLDELARETRGKSGRDLRSIVERAIQRAVSVRDPRRHARSGAHRAERLRARMSRSYHRLSGAFLNWEDRCGRLTTALHREFLTYSGDRRYALDRFNDYQFGVRRRARLRLRPGHRAGSRRADRG